MTGSMNAVVSLCRELKLPAVAREAERLAGECARQGVDHLGYLQQLLEQEQESRVDRRAQRRTKEAGFPLIKTLSGFDFRRNPDLPEAQLWRLSEGRYIETAESVLFVGDPGTGKTHLATALGVCAARQGRRVRFVTAGRLVNELVESRNALELSRVVSRYARVDLLILDELGYLPLSKSDAELLFQVLSERAERRSLVLTTNLPFSEWTTIFPDPRLCRAVIDRLTHRSQIIDTGKTSIRLEEALRRRATSLQPTPNSSEVTE
jgi:DNA replication protein DnaC